MPQVLVDVSCNRDILDPTYDLTTLDLESQAEAIGERTADNVALTQPQRRLNQQSAIDSGDAVGYGRLSVCDNRVGEGWGWGREETPLSVARGLGSGQSSGLEVVDVSCESALLLWIAALICSREVPFAPQDRTPGVDRARLVTVGRDACTLYLCQFPLRPSFAATFPGVIR